MVNVSMNDVVNVRASCLSLSMSECRQSLSMSACRQIVLSFTLRVGSANVFSFVRLDE